MAIFLPQRWKRQPQYPVGIDWANPLTKRLQFVWSGALWSSPALGRASAQAGFLNGGGIVTDTFGRGIRTAEATANKSLIETTTFSTAEMSYLLFGRFPTVGGGSGTWRDYVAASNGSGSVVLEIAATGTSAGAIGAFSTGTWSGAGILANVSVLGRAVTVVMSASVQANLLAVVYDGAVQASGTYSTSQTATQSRLFGDPARGTIRDPAMTCAALWARWDRRLSEAEALTLDENPWQLFRPAANQTFYSLPSSGGAFSLSLDAGNYALTGRDVGTTSARSIGIDAGSYTLTGRAVDFSFGRQLVLDAGSYSLTGRNVDLTSARSLGLDAGSYALTGRDVTLTYLAPGNFTLALDSGTYNLTGRDVTFNVTLSMLLDSGAYSLTGRTVGLTWSGETPVEITDRIVTLRSLTERWRM